MARGWLGSNRRNELPGDWQTIRRKILNNAGGRCQWITSGNRCTEPATDVDHITPGGSSREDNLQALCAWHHARKSSAEGGRARPHSSNKHPTEQHPARR